MDAFHADFPEISQQDWLQQVQKDLKGRPVDELIWPLTADIQVTPFQSPEDFQAPPIPLTDTPLQWVIGETIASNDAAEANTHALRALEMGAEGLCFESDTASQSIWLDTALQGVYLDYIQLFIGGKGVQQNPGDALISIKQVAGNRQINMDRVYGGLYYQPYNPEGLSDWRYAAELSAFAAQNMPHVRLFVVRSKAEWNVVVQLADLLRQANQILSKIKEQGADLTVINGQLHFELSIGTSYWLEMAKIRAFRILWMNLLQAWQLPVEAPFITVSFKSDAYTDDLYTNMIRATTMSMAAVLGGADWLTVRPYDQGREDQTSYGTAFSSRIARNVQHLLKMESHLTLAIDPAAGTYYVEQLTEKLAQAAWTEFKK